MKHKWAKEIKAFVDGKDVEYRLKMHYEPEDENKMFFVEEWSSWSKVYNLIAFNNNDDYQFRVKKETK